MAGMALWIGFSVFGQTDDRTARRETRRQAVEEKAKEMANPPGEAQLGAPIYPGAVYDARNSAGMSLSGQTMYLFLTIDPPEKVAEFYGKKLGIQASSYAPGKYMIPLKGNLPLPEKGISIDPNKLFDQKYKTVITFFSPST